MKKNVDAISTHLPLTEPTFLILISLMPAPRHGYAIARDVQVLSRDRVLLSTSTLYTALKRLLEDGWIERSGNNETSEKAGRPRKTYQLTELGRQIIQAETNRLSSLLRAARNQSA